MASALCASYIGGSVNFAAVSQSLGLTPGPLLAASMAADNIAMAVYLTAIMIIPAKNVVAASQKRGCPASSLPGSENKAPQQQGITDSLLSAWVAHKRNEPAATAHTLCFQLALLQLAHQCVVTLDPCTFECCCLCNLQRVCQHHTCFMMDLRHVHICVIC